MNNDKVLQLQAISNVLQHQLLTDPLRATIDQFKKDELAQEWPRLVQTDTEQEGIELLQAFLTTWKGSEEEEIELRVDFTQLLCGIGAPLSPPWGSVYLAENNQLNGPSTQELLHFYSRHNINVDYPINEPVDHLGLMLSVVAHLLGLIANTQENQHQVQVLKELLNAHLFPFAERVFQLMVSHAETDYYLSVAKLGQAYIQALAAHFDIIPTQRKLFL